MKLKEKIEKYVPYNEQEEKDKQTMIKYIETFDDVLTRENEFGHFTGSAWMLNKERTKILMIYHNIYDSWALLGGHADGEENLLNVAIREVKEETGINNVNYISDEIFSLEILPVKGHVKRDKYVSTHIHLNITYLFEGDEKESTKIKEDENSGVKWIDIDEVVKYCSEEHMKIIYQKLINKLNKL